MDEEYIIAEVTEPYLDRICEIENISFSVPWSKESFMGLLANPFCKAFAAVKSGIVAGYIIDIQIGNEAEILNIAVAPESRKLGIGRKLLDHALDSMKSADGLTVYLEVRESNSAARHLYASKGFREIAVRKGYYIKPREDAIEMKLEK